MRLRRSWRDAEPLSNLLVRATCRNQLHDLLLTRSQRGRALQHRRHGRDANNVVSERLLAIWRNSNVTPHGESRNL